jgi:hypothetical protein
MRAAMSDGEFWQHVLGAGHTDDGEWLIEGDAPPLGEPCTECGAHAACAYDEEGRPMIHATGGDDE